MLVPRVGRRGDAENKPALIETARSAGFTRVIDLTDAFDGLDPARLTVDRDDFHPNAAGHARLAERLDEAIKTLPEIAGIWEMDHGHSKSRRLARGADKIGVLSDPEVRATRFAPGHGGRAK